MKIKLLRFLNQIYPKFSYFNLHNKVILSQTFLLNLYMISLLNQSIVTKIQPQQKQLIKRPIYEILS